MPYPPPNWLEHLAAADAGARDRAWQQFLGEFSALMLHVIRRTSGDQDVVMDRYVFVLDALKRDGYRRLRRFQEDGRGKFSTWLVAVVRRLCVDEHRARYGRPQSEGESEWQAERRSLVELVGDELALERLEASSALPDGIVEAREALDALQEAVAELDVRQRLILRLRFEDGVSVPEIARMLDYASVFKLYREIDKLLLDLRKSLVAAGVRSAEG